MSLRKGFTSSEVELEASGHKNYVPIPGVSEERLKRRVRKGLAACIHLCHFRTNPSTETWLRVPYGGCGGYGGMVWRGSGADWCDGVLAMVWWFAVCVLLMPQAAVRRVNAILHCIGWVVAAGFVLYYTRLAEILAGDPRINW